MTRKRRSVVDDAGIKRSITEENSVNFFDEETSDEETGVEGFHILRVPSHLLVKVFQKTTQSERINALKTCRSLYDFFIDSQNSYDILALNKEYHRMQISCNEDNINFSFSIYGGGRSSPEFSLPIEECRRIREHTFEIRPNEVMVEISNLHKDFIEAISGVLLKCYCLILGKMPNRDTGLLINSIAKNARVLRFNELEDTTLLPEYINQNQNIVSVWFRNIPMEGDDMLDFFINAGRSMRKIIMGGASISGQKLIEFVTKVNFLTSPCLLSPDELRLTAADRLAMRDLWAVDVDKHTKVATFKSHGVNIVVSVIIVSGLP